MQTETIILGGGMAGMACAMKLLVANHDFLLITENLGGRMMYSETEKVNFGAYFIMGNYANAKKMVVRETLLKPTDVCFHNSDTERFAVLSLHTLGNLPEFLNFYLAMRKFSSHYELYKNRCLTLSQKEALQADPYMADIYAKSASEFIHEKKYEKVAADYISKFSYACTGVSPDTISALDFLNVSMGMLVPIHRFKFDRQAMVDKLGDHFAVDSVIKIESQENKHLLHTKSGKTYQAENIVLATPAAVTKELLGLSEIRDACKIFVFHVKASLKPIYCKYEINLFSDNSEIMLTAKQFDGSYLIYSRVKDVDLQQVCSSYELLSSVDWQKAMYVFGKAYMDQQYGNSIYVAGDHNGLGLEPAAISGIYAANQIIKK